MFSVLALAGSALAYNATTTVETTAYVTIPCSSGQVLTYGSLTYTATHETTLTVKDCSCSHDVSLLTTAAAASATHTSEASLASSAEATSHSTAVLANGAAAAPAAAAAGVAAVVAYLL